MKAIVMSVLMLAYSALAGEKELTNEEVIRELQGGGRPYTPEHFIFSVKPISFIFSQVVSDGLPYPLKCIQVKGKLFKNLGVQAEPIFILGGDGGAGFTVGPTFIPDFQWEEVHLTAKYEFNYIKRMGAFHGGFLELTRHRLFKYFVFTYGGAIGFSVNGAVGSEDFEGNTRVLEIKQGLTFDFNIGLGFAL